MRRIVNKTPHLVTILNDKNEVIATFDKSDNPIRLKAETVRISDFCGCPMSKTVYSTPIGLPDYEEGICYIVSQLVKTALPQRDDLLVPAEVVRDESGNILGCKSLGL